MAAPNGRGPDDRLDSLKQIAAYVGRTERTVRRWERSEGFPLHRSGHKKSVWAYRSEIDAWWDQRSQNPPPDLEDDLEPEPGPTPEVKSEPEPEPGPSAPPVSAPLPSRRAGAWFPRAAVIAVPVLFAAGLVVTRPWSLAPPLPAIPWTPDRIFARATAEGGVVGEIALPGPAFNIELSPDGRFLYAFDAGSNGRIVRVIDTERRSIVSTLHVPGHATALACSRDGVTLYFGTESGGLQIADRKTGQSRFVRAGIEGNVHHLALSPGEEWLYVSQARRGLKRYRIKTGEVLPVPSVVCPKYLAFDPSGRFLAISKQCGEPSGIPARDSVDILDLTSGRRHLLLQGPPLVGGAVTWIPQTDRILVDGWDACRSSIYGHNRADCPVFPGQVAYVWQTSDGALARTVALPDPDFFECPPAFSPDGHLSVMGGRSTARVMDTTFFRVQEGWKLRGIGLKRPRLDPHRRRLYFAVSEAPKIYALDLPAQDCNPPSLGVILHWPLDGALAERIQHRDFTSPATPEFVPGLVGQAVNLTRAALEFRTRSMLADAVTAGDGSFALWLRPQSPGRIAEFLGDGKPLWRLSLSASLEPVFQAEDFPPLAAGSPLAASRWHHLAVARHAGQIQLFLDGRPHASANIPATGPQIHATERTLRVGPLPAVIDEVTVFNHFLSASDLAALIRQAKSCLTEMPSGPT